MHLKYLGDSYDIVKRFWADALREIAPLYAHPRFIPEEIRTPYSSATGITVLDKDGPRLSARFGLLLDPDTGLDARSEALTTQRHVSIRFLIEQFESLAPRYVVCFDQSFHRVALVGRRQQMREKQRRLARHGISSFYYDSHAPFLFLTTARGITDRLRGTLVSQGIPRVRLTQITDAKRPAPTPRSDRP